MSQYRTSLRIDADLADRVQAEADEHGVSFNAMVSQLIEAGLTRGATKAQAKIIADAARAAVLDAMLNG